jgi:Ni/Fe-hydrogenase subunit HybB-like protein
LTSTFPEEAQFNTLMTVAIFAAIAIYLISVINDFRRDTKYFYKTIPLLISIPLTWNVISIIMYSSVKVASYPSFLPLMEFLHGLIF